MYIKIALILSVILQFLAAAIAISLIRRTRYNISWILISIGFLLMAARRLVELIQLYHNIDSVPNSLLTGWMAVLISLLMFIGVIYIKQIFNIQERIEAIRKQNESKVFSAIIQTEEKSRQEFAKELHDGLGPLLSSVKMSVSAIDSSKINLSNREIVTLTEQNIDEAIIAVKEISNNLSPHILKNYGLQQALENFIQRFQVNENLDIRLSSNIKNQRFDYNSEIILYRIVGELIRNTIKHASASKVELNIFYEKNSLELIYSDNGIGLNLQANEGKYSGIGLSNIESRVKSLNGNMEIVSNPGEGFNLKINLSL